MRSTLFPSQCNQHALFACIQLIFAVICWASPKPDVTNVARFDEPFKLCAKARFGDPFSAGHRLFYQDNQVMVGNVNRLNSGQQYPIIFTLSQSHDPKAMNHLIIVRETPSGVATSPLHIMINPYNVGDVGVVRDGESKPVGYMDYGFAVTDDNLLGHHRSGQDTVATWRWRAWPTAQEGVYKLSWEVKGEDGIGVDIVVGCDE